MKRAILLLMLGLSLAPVLCWAAEPKADEAKAIAEIEKLGGKVETNKTGKVVDVNLSNATRLQDKDLAFLKDLPTIRTLNLYHTPTSDQGLAHLKNLREIRVLDIRNTAVTDRGFKHLEGLSELRTLYLGDRITDDGLTSLRNLINLETLTLETRQVTNEGLKHIRELKHLQELDLRVTSITDDGLVHLSSLENLVTLRVGSQLPYQFEVPRPPRRHGPQLTDLGLEQIKKLTKLENLDLHNSQITDKGLAQLKGLKGLRCLDVSGAKVTATGTQDLVRELPKLKIILERERGGQTPSYTPGGK